MQFIDSYLRKYFKVKVKKVFSDNEKHFQTYYKRLTVFIMGFQNMNREFNSLANTPSAAPKFSTVELVPLYHSV